MYVELFCDSFINQTINQSIMRSMCIVCYGKSSVTTQCEHALCLSCFNTLLYTMKNWSCPCCRQQMIHAADSAPNTPGGIVNVPYHQQRRISPERNSNRSNIVDHESSTIFTVLPMETLFYESLHMDMAW